MKIFSLFIILISPFIFCSAFAQNGSAKLGDRCFSMTPMSGFNDKTCQPVKVAIQFLDCKSGGVQEKIEGMARFECKTRSKKLKYWYRDTMYFGELEKTAGTYVVAETHSLVYGKKDNTTGVVAPFSAVVAKDISPNLPIPVPTATVKPEMKAEAKVEPKLVDAPKPAVVALPPMFQDVKFTGLIDFYYLYNFNVPPNVLTPTPQNSYSYGAAPTETVTYLPKTYHDQFTVNMAMLGAKKEAKPWGFNINLAFGPEADLMATANSDNSMRALNQAYLIYKTPFDLVIEMGRFHSFMGFESHFATENMNYTKSFATYWATPAILTGVHLMMPLGDFLKADFYLVNGWNKTYDNNKSKSFGGAVTFKPLEEIEIIAKALGGNETTNGGADTRTALEGDIVFKPMSSLKAAVSYVLTQESLSGGNQTKVSSLAAYAQYFIIPEFSVAARYEVYTDDGIFSDGLVSATPSAAGMSQTINTITGTLAYHASDNLTFKAEYRMDSTNAATPAYLDPNGVPTATQSMALFAGVLGF